MKRIAFSQFHSKKYVNSFGRNSRNTWHELPKITKYRLRKIVEARDGLICSGRYGHGCSKSFKSHDLTMDHIIPIRAGGPICDIGNMQLLCQHCHEIKTMKIDVVYSSMFVYSPRAGAYKRRRTRL